MERDVAVQAIVRHMRHIAHQTKNSQQPWQSKGENALLVMLLLQGGSALPGEMAQASNVSTARIAVLLRQMEGKGLIVREPDAEDRRRVLVILTDEGRKRAKSQFDCMFAMWGRLVDALGEADTENLVRILDKIGTFVEEDNVHCNA